VRRNTEGLVVDSLGIGVEDNGKGNEESSPVHGLRKVSHALRNVIPFFSLGFRTIHAYSKKFLTTSTFRMDVLYSIPLDLSLTMFRPTQASHYQQIHSYSPIVPPLSYWNLINSGCDDFVN
jgi:hypothetical protein